MTLDTSPSPPNANPYLATHPYQPPPPPPRYPGMYTDFLVFLDRPDIRQKTQKIGLPVNSPAQPRSQGSLLPVKKEELGTWLTQSSIVHYYTKFQNSVKFTARDI